MDQEENAFKRECQLLRSEEIIMRKDIFELQKIVVHHQDLLAKLTLIKQTTCVNKCDCEYNIYYNTTTVKTYCT